MGKFEAAELKGVDLIIKFEFIRLLRKMLHLMTRERTCRDFLRVARRCNPGYTTSAFPDWEFSVPIAVLRELVAHFDSTNIQLEIYSNRALYVSDEDGQCRAHSLLSFITQEQMNVLTLDAQMSRRHSRRAI